MKNQTLMIIWCSLLCSCLSLGEERDWKSSGGTSIKGSLMSADKTGVRIKKADDGRIIRVILGQLSDADQIYVKEWMKDNRFLTVIPSNVSKHKLLKDAVPNTILRAVDDNVWVRVDLRVERPDKERYPSLKLSDIRLVVKGENDTEVFLRPSHSIVYGSDEKGKKYERESDMVYLSDNEFEENAALFFLGNKDMFLADLLIKDDERTFRVPLR